MNTKSFSNSKLIHQKPQPGLIRIILGVSLAILGLNALAGGYYAMTGAKGVPVAWLTGSIFKSYFVPGLFLFLVIGGVTLYSSIAVFRRIKHHRATAIFSAMLLIVWLACQVLIIGYVSWMQPATLAFSLIILFFSLMLKAH